MTFRVGQKVVCVGSDGTPGIDWNSWCAYWKVARPQRGPVYTVRDTRIGSNGRQLIRLIEIKNPIVEFRDSAPQEPWWWASAFRPVIERETDISFAHEILKKATRKVPALALSPADRGAGS